MTDTTADHPEAAGQELDVLGTFDHLKEALFRYYNTPFGLADELLERERQQLFDIDGGAWRNPLLEVRPQYVSVGSDLAGSVREAGAHPDLSELAQLGLLRGVPSLYQHQHQALVSAMRDGRNVVVTAGTGSGKTESFMLPILAGLVQESAAWPASSLPVNRWWGSPRGEYQPQRAGERGRHAAVRALVLYPMNALVDDQMMRLRKALDSDEVRNWFARNRPGHRFYFGRYTGATPVPGDIGSRSGVKTLRKEFASTEERSRQAHKAGGDGRFFIPRLDGAEMRCRWDMIQAPPDIMITNYSMLNVMLMRSREGSIFEKTRRWLEEVPEARFTLVVDELHMYRGTAGTEIAYLLRNLRHRLGLDDKPEKFRILAASASLEAPRDLDFLQEFFGTDRERFEVLGGHLLLPKHTHTDISSSADAYARLDEAAPDSSTADKVLTESGGREAFVNALREGDRLIADFDRNVADRLFSEAEPSIRMKALRGVLAALRTSEDPVTPKLRGHLFFRNIPGVWACSDPDCREAERPEGHERTVGKLYSRPTPRCGCGARVLELLYCQSCGDVYLGGYAPESAFADSKGAFEAGLLADLPDLDALPDAAALGPSAANYVVYWPRRDKPAINQLAWSPTSDKGSLSAGFEFKRSKYDPRTGMLRNHRDYTGWSFHVTVPQSKRGSNRLKLENLPAAPTQCPSCGDDWEVRQLGSERLSLSDPRRMRTPVRSMRTGFEKINQVLTTGLLSLLPHRQAVVFSDSRQDAAKLSAGLGLRHYQDLLRLLLADEVTNQGDPVKDLEAVTHYYARTAAGDHVDPAAASAAHKRLRARDPETYDRWEKHHKPSAGLSLSDLHAAEPDPAEEAELRTVLSHVPSLDSHASAITERLVQQGVNPGGPKASLQETAHRPKGTDPEPWTTLYQWPDDDGPVRDTSVMQLSEPQEHLRQEIRETLHVELLGGLFGSAGRDFESLGLGWLAQTSDQAPLEADRASHVALARASLRVLGHMRRFAGLRSHADEPPRKLRVFWEAAAQHLGQDSDDVRAAVERTWGNAVIKYLIQPEHVALRHGRAASWTCPNCRRRHLHPGVGLCTKCGALLPAESAPFDNTDSDYYAWMARRQLGAFRLNTAELTGQTDRIDAQNRQARFQGIFLDGKEHRKPDTLDVLSVTTTMEAGVDIGPLSAVLMANMPPTRFNYQQRVGRAGRRTSPVALALTVCRGRSHDEHYFQDPQRITNDATPRPYLSTEMRDIYERVLAAEVLRQSFSDVRPEGNDGEELDPTRNVHGQFGRCADWSAASGAVAKWIASHHSEVRALTEALAAHTRGTWSPDEMTAWVTEKLTPRVTEIAEASHGHPDLSQRLAEAGLLPMFGFPTSARYLYTKRPYDSYPWPPKGVVDRSLDIAISQFAPGAETVKDGQVHTATGVVAFEPTGHRPRAVDNPLGPDALIGLCRACGHLAEHVQPQPSEDEDSPSQPCPACGAADGSYREVGLREPAGFFCSGKARDFDGNFSWRARSLAPRTAADLESGAPERLAERGLVVHSGKGRRYAVNDNGGRLFAFSKVSPAAPWSGAYLEAGAVEQFPWLAKDIPSGSDALMTAIGASQHTDLFLLGPRAGELPEAGLRLNLASVPQKTGFPDDRSGRRAGWYSLAALLRTAAGSLLQVQPTEIASGIHGAGSAHREARTFAFLSDTLDNGAGYCTHLAEPEVFNELIATAHDLLASYGSGTHSRECRGSCYECLRDYTNMAYHSLLDWRLAGDLLSILRREDTAPSHQPRAAASLLESWASDAEDAEFIDDLGGTGPAVLFEDRVWVAAKSPFEAADTSMEAERLSQVRAAVAEHSPDVPDVVFVDDFLLDKAPARVTALLFDFDAEQ